MNCVNKMWHNIIKLNWLISKLNKYKNKVQYVKKKRTELKRVEIKTIQTIQKSWRNQNKSR